MESMVFVDIAVYVIDLFAECLNVQQALRVTV